MRFLICVSFVAMLFIAVPNSSEARCRVFAGRRPVLRVAKFLNPVKLLRAPVRWRRSWDNG